MKSGFSLPPCPYLALGRGCIFALQICHHLLIYCDISGGFGDLFSSIRVLVPRTMRSWPSECVLGVRWGYPPYQCLATRPILHISEETAFLVTSTSFRKVGKLTLIFSKKNAVCLHKFL